MRSTHWWRPPVVGTSWIRHIWPGSPSRTRIFRAGLPCEPSRCFYQNLSIKLELAILPSQLSQLVFLVCRQSVFPKTLISICLSYPSPNRHRRHSKFSGQIRRLPAGSNQLHDLVPKLLWIWWSCLAHCSLPSASAAVACGVVENGAPTPFTTASTGTTTTTAIKCPPYRGSSRDRIRKQRAATVGSGSDQMCGGRMVPSGSLYWAGTNSCPGGRCQGTLRCRPWVRQPLTTASLAAC